jgi:hypothetical protein
VFLLPYIEQDNLYKLWNGETLRYYATPVEARQPIKTLFCPNAAVAATKRVEPALLLQRRAPKRVDR